MGKSTIFRSERVMVGLNAFDPGQEHALHAMKAWTRSIRSSKAEDFSYSKAMTFPCKQFYWSEGAPHGIRNTGTERLLVLVILAPAP